MGRGQGRVTSKHSSTVKLLAWVPAINTNDGDDAYYPWNSSSHIFHQPSPNMQSYEVSPMDDVPSIHDLQ